MAGELSSLQEWFLFLVPGQIPQGGRPHLIVVKRNGIFVVELKYSELPIFGSINGPWEVKDVDGTVVWHLASERGQNPYQQVDTYWRQFRDFLRREAHFFWPSRADWLRQNLQRRLPLRSAVVICPKVPPGSQINTDWKVPCMGLDELGRYLWTEGHPDFHLDVDEARQLTRHLQLRRWQDMESFISSMPGLPEVDWESYAQRVRNENAIPVYVMQQIRLGGKLVSLEEAIQSQPRLLLLGPAGSGKTTNLRQVHIGLLARVPEQVPIRLELELYDPQEGLRDLVRQGLLVYGLQLGDEDFKRLLTSAELVLLMDGWTEIPPVNRDYLRREYRRWLTEYPHHRHVIAARRYEVQGAAEAAELAAVGVPIAELQPFSNADLRQFLERKLGFEVDLDDIPPRLKEVVQWPLYADMLARLLKDKGKVDVTSVAELVENVLSRELEKGAGVLSDSLRDELDEFLTELAAEMHTRLVTVVPRSQARSCIRRIWRHLHGTDKVVTAEERVMQAAFESPLIIAQGSKVRFAHQLFQEFFAGRWLAVQLESASDQCGVYLASPWWAYPAVFAAAMVKRETAPLNLRHCLQQITSNEDSPSAAL